MNEHKVGDIVYHVFGREIRKSKIKGIINQNDYPMCYLELEGLGYEKSEYAEFPYFCFSSKNEAIDATIEAIWKLKNEVI